MPNAAELAGSGRDATGFVVRTFKCYGITVKTNLRLQDITRRPDPTYYDRMKRVNTGGNTPGRVFFLDDEAAQGFCRRVELR